MFIVLSIRRALQAESGQHLYMTSKALDTSVLKGTFEMYIMVSCSYQSESW